MNVAVTNTTLDQLPVVLWILGLASVVVAVSSIVRLLILPLHRTMKKLMDFTDEWHGQPARPGHPRVPGVAERLITVETQLQAVKSELTPNHGSTLRDAINRTEDTVMELMRRVVEEDNEIREDVNSKYAESLADRAGIREILERVERDAKKFHDEAHTERERLRADLETHTAEELAREDRYEQNRQGDADEQHGEHETIIDQTKEPPGPQV